MAGKNPKSNNQKDEPNPEYRNFQQELKRVLSVSKEELDRRRAEHERERKKRGKSIFHYPLRG